VDTTAGLHDSEKREKNVLPLSVTELLLLVCRACGLVAVPTVLMGGWYENTDIYATEMKTLQQL
jgi:hypothetical protein